MTVAGLVAGVLGAIGFVAWELRTARAHEDGHRVEPMLDVRISPTGRWPPGRCR